MKNYLTLKEAFLDSENAENQITVIEKGGHIKQMTYQTLRIKAEKFASYFYQKQIRKGDRVVIAVSDTVFYWDVTELLI